MNWLKEFVYRFRGEYTTERLISMGMRVGKNFVRLNGHWIHIWKKRESAWKQPPAMVRITRFGRMFAPKKRTRCAAHLKTESDLLTDGYEKNQCCYSGI